MTEAPKNLEQVSADLDYVRNVVRRAEDRAGFPVVYFLWALLTFPGMAIIDVAPEKAGAYWAVAGPLGGLASWLLAARAARRSGFGHRGEGTLNAWQWTGLAGTILLLVPLIAGGELRGVTISRVILLFIAFAYLTSGHFLDRRMRWVALAVYAGYVLTFALDAYAWTAVGAIISLSLIATGWLAARAHRAAA